MCIETISQLLCDNAEWMEADFEVSARELLQHITNDCAGMSLTCDVRSPPLRSTPCKLAELQASFHQSVDPQRSFQYHAGWLIRKLVSAKCEAAKCG
jgi:hypothetical protein